MPAVQTASAALSENTAEEIYEDLRGAWTGGVSREVDFRALVPGVAATERLSHQLHPYPAKLLRHIPALFASAPQIVGPGGTVFDPFCGSGTVLVEAQAAGRRAIGLDTNPLARLLARVKTTALAEEVVADAVDMIASRASELRARTAPVPPRFSYWFEPHAAEGLCKLRAAIGGCPDRRGTSAAILSELSQTAVAATSGAVVLLIWEAVSIAPLW